MEQATKGWVNGFVGMILFSASLPATRLAVQDLDPVFLTMARAAIAGVLALVWLLWQRTTLPARRDVIALAVIALGIVFGFPLFSSIALQSISSAHSLVFIGLLPLATALSSAALAGERPTPAFWLFAILGAAAVVGFALSQDGSGELGADALMVAAIAVCGIGYAEGGRLARHMGALPVICWVLVLSLPLSAPLAIGLRPAQPAAVSAQAWLGLAYVAVFAMFVGFVFWYRGLAQGGIAAVGQLQLLQPFFGLLLAALVLGETVSGAMLLVTAWVVACVAGAKSASAPRRPRAVR